MHFDGKMIFNVMLGAVIALAVYTILLKTPIEKVADKIPYNKP
jgi:hypothetical protein